MKAIIIGASGATGKSLVSRLLQADEFSEVTVLVRHNVFEAHPKLKQIVVDFERLNDFAEHITGDVAFSCMGTTLKIAGSKAAQWKVDYDYQYLFAQIACHNGVPAFVLLSAQNANASSSIFYSKMKGRLEKVVEELHFNKLIILQPSLLIRPNTDRLTEKIGLKVIRAFNKLGLLEKLAPLHVNMVAAAMIKSVGAFNAMVKKIGVKEIAELGK
ncbi:MAG: NAD(P)H-binding protein [Paludibacteraceae bacterium]|nr:NAD(P)H-binding protein [Paludibacteraceae bacterium]